ncbi:MAG: hypothetical protein ACSHXB_16075 [Sulfitobacter sp.]
MLGMQHVFLSQKDAHIVPLDQIDQTHGIGAKSARMYTRFFGQTGVRLNTLSHCDMLIDALEGLLADRPHLREIDGYGIYTKTQTHNTFFEQSWLNDIFSHVGLGHWETLTFSMTNCASGLAAVHFGATLDQPFIVLSGEKAFHPAGNRLSVGLLGEAAVSVLFAPGGKLQVRDTKVAHLPRYHINPDDMALEDRKALQTDFEVGLTEFLKSNIAQDPEFFARNPVIVPYNLNPPLIERVLRNAGLDGNIADGADPQNGHMFCSDNFHSVARDMPPEGSSIFLFSAGHGVTFAAVKLEPTSFNSSSKKEIQ